MRKITSVAMVAVCMCIGDARNTTKLVASEQAATRTTTQPAKGAKDASSDEAISRELSRSSGSVPNVRSLPDSEVTYDNLVRLLRSDDYRERYTAACGLTGTSRFGWKGTKQQANELAMMALKDPYWACRYEAAKFIYWRGKLAEETVPALIEALDSEEPLVRNQCVLALGTTGGAVKAHDALCRLLMAADQLDAVAPVLLESGPEGHKVLVVAAQSRNADVRLWCNAALAREGINVDAYVKELTASLQSGQKSRIVNGCKSAECARGAAAPAGRRMATLLKDDDIDLRWAAASALKEAAPKDTAVVNALVDGLSDKSVQTQCSAALYRIGPAARSAIPALLDLMENDGRLDLLLPLEAIDPRAPEALPVLIRLLRKTLTKRPNEAVIAAIGAYGPAAKAAIPDLIRVLHVKSDHPYYIDAAIWALGQIGPDARAVRGEVMKFIPGSFAETARVALKRIDAQDPATMPAPEARYTGRTLSGNF
jgi:HEAT repeat protein